MKQVLKTCFGLLGLAKLADSANPGFYETSQDFPFSGMMTMSLYIDDTASFNNILDHGCHCARFDSLNDKDYLGGNQPVDQLDEICKNWYQARKCLNNFDQGTCQNLDNDGFNYEMQLSVDVNNKPTDVVCSTQNSQNNRDYNDCEYDSCLVDAFYVKQVAQFINENPGFTVQTVNDANDCPKETLLVSDRYCAGTAPEVEIVAGLPPTADLGLISEQVEDVSTTTDIPIVQELGSETQGHMLFIIDRSSENSDAEYQGAINAIVNVILPLTIGPNNTVITLLGMSNTTNVYGERIDSEASFNSIIEQIRNDQSDIPDRNALDAMEIANLILGVNRGLSQEFKPRGFGGFIGSFIFMALGGTFTGPQANNNPWNDFNSAGGMFVAMSFGQAATETNVAAEVDNLTVDPVFNLVTDVVNEIVGQITEVIDRFTEIFVQVANGVNPTPTAAFESTTSLSTSTSTTTTSTSSTSTSTEEPTTSTTSTTATTSTSTSSTSTTTEPTTSTNYTTSTSTSSTSTSTEEPTTSTTSTSTTSTTTEPTTSTNYTTSTSSTSSSSQSQGSKVKTRGQISGNIENSIRKFPLKNP